MESGAIRPSDRARACRMAYRTLLAMGRRELPVDVVGILGRCRGTRVMSYSEAGQVLGQSVYGIAGALPSVQACTMVYEYGGTRLRIVLYNDDVCFGNRGSRRWSLAHELGHIVLGHREDGWAAEGEANCFAQHLLCPRPLLEVLPVPGEDLVRVAFGLSGEAARIALRDAGRRSGLIDGETRQAVLDFYGVGEGSTWSDILSPIQRGAAQRRGGILL